MAELPTTAQRTRAFKPKSKNGCFNCKMRHNKCDETKPACLRCVRLKRTCGYATDHKRPKVSPPIRIAPAIAAPLSISSPQIKPFIGTASEQRSFHFFIRETSQQVCGVFGSKFWLQDILQACHHSPTIRSAAIAFGGLHEQFRAQELPLSHVYTEPVPRDLTIQHYNKAIQLLTQPVDQNSELNAHVALITCMLFICFESLRGKLANTLAHINAGVKILQEIQSEKVTSRRRILNTRQTPYTSISTLTELFTRLDIQASGWVIGRTVKLFHHIEHDESSSPPSLVVPMKFASLGEASFAQEQILSSWLQDFQHATPGQTARSVKALVHLSARYTDKVMLWNNTFNNFLTARKTTTFAVNDQRAIHILLLQHIPMLIYTVIDHERAAIDETIWDDYTPEFEQMIHHASAIIDPVLMSAKAPMKPIFSMEPGILAPLFFIATRCRHPGVRREAISLLYSCPRKEGLWDNFSAAKRAEVMMEIEENYLPANGSANLKSDLARMLGGKVVPAAARICGYVMELEVLETGRSTLALLFIRPPRKGKVEGDQENIVRDILPFLDPEDHDCCLFDTRKDRHMMQSVYWTRYSDFLQRCP